MGVKLSLSKRVETTTETDLYAIDKDLHYVGFLKRLSVTNESTSSAFVKIFFYNEDVSKQVLELAVGAGETKALKEEELPEEAFPTKMSVVASAQPVSIDFTIELD